MDFQPFASPLLENAVNEFAKLPGIGRKTALRLVLHLLRQDESVAESFGNAVIRLRREVHYCNVCHNISDTVNFYQLVVSGINDLIQIILKISCDHLGIRLAYSLYPKTV